MNEQQRPPDAMVAHVNVNYESLDFIRCPECEGVEFSEIIIMKAVPKVLSKTRQLSVIQLRMLKCNGCNSRLLLKGLELEKYKDKRADSGIPDKGQRSDTTKEQDI